MEEKLHWGDFLARVENDTVDTSSNTLKKILTKITALAQKKKDRPKIHTDS